MGVHSNNQGMVKLKRYLDRRNITQDSIAYVIHTTTGTVSSKLCGHVQFKLNEIQALCRYLELTDKEKLDLFEL